MTSDTTSTETPNPRISLIEGFHQILLEESVDQPMRAVECALIAACMLSALTPADEAAFLHAARLAWTEGIIKRQTKIYGPRGNSHSITVALDPDENRLRISERLLTLAQSGDIEPIIGAALLLQLSAGWASTSLAITCTRFVQAAKWAYERSGHWFQLEAAPPAG